MIRSFTHRGLQELFEKGKTKYIPKAHHKRCLSILAVIHSANSVSQIGLPGYRLHPLKQYAPLRWSVDVNGPWRITFEFQDGDAYRVELTQPH